MIVTSAREAALLALSACDSQGAWSDGYLKKIGRDSELDSRDMALATRICFGVLQNRILLDYYLGRLCSRNLNQLENKVLNCLRIGAYQILMLDRVPDRAAVNESVNLARKHSRNPKVSGFVNGVLRTLSRQRDELPEPPDDAVALSHPAWLADVFTERLGREGALALMAADNGQPPTVAQVNTYLTDTASVTASLQADGVSVEPHPWLPDCLLLTDTGNMERLDAFQKGYFYVQDAAARLAVLAAGPRPGMSVLDACAAPGGKSFAAAIMMKNQGRVISCDIHPHKEHLIKAGADRLGLSVISPKTLDSKTPEPSFVQAFDLVIADVPCSGLGIIRKKPDIRYKDPKPLENLPKVQAAILGNVSDYVRHGGVLLYATCTLLQRENEAVVQKFLSTHPDFSLDPVQLPGPFTDTDTGMVTCWPHLHGTDGFFFARLKRA